MTSDDETKDVPEVDLLGEGDETGELVPGKSLVFAMMEVCLCLLVRQIPPLNPNPGGATAILGQRGYLPTEENGKLIAAALSVMESLPSLCSPAGKTEKILNIFCLEKYAMNFKIIFRISSNIADSSLSYNWSYKRNGDSIRK